MWIRRCTDQLLSNNLLALGVIFAVSGLPLIGIIGTLIAILITLRKGMQEGALAFVASLLPVLLIYKYMPQQQIPDTVLSIFDIVIMLLVINLIAWLSASILRRTSSWSIVLDTLGLLGTLCIIALHLAYPDLATWWQHWLTDYAHGISQAVGGDDNALASLKQMPVALRNVATGLSGVVCSVYALTGLLIARWWQAVLYNPGGLRQELMQIRLSKASGVVAVICLLGALAHVAMLQDALLIIAMIYVIAGFSFMHYAITQRRIKWWWLTIIYVVLFLYAKSIWLIAVAGFIDMAIDGRKKLATKLV